MQNWDTKAEEKQESMYTETGEEIKEGSVEILESAMMMCERDINL